MPIENSLEGSVNATLDALAVETEDVAIVGEVVHPIHTCLIAREPLELSAIETSSRTRRPPRSARASCARACRRRACSPASSTAEAVRIGRRASDGACGGARQPARRGAATAARCCAPASRTSPATRRASSGSAPPRRRGPPTGEHGPWKTAIVFWGVGAEAPGWLVRCLSEFACRGVNLTRIESRPRKQGLGRYMFFADLEGRADERPVAEALDGAPRARRARCACSARFPPHSASCRLSSACEGAVRACAPATLRAQSVMAISSTTSAIGVRAATGAPAART